MQCLLYANSLITKHKRFATDHSLYPDIITVSTIVNSGALHLKLRSITTLDYLDLYMKSYKQDMDTIIPLHIPEIVGKPFRIISFACNVVYSTIVNVQVIYMYILIY